MFIRPTSAAVKVREPETGHYLPAEGKHVPETIYWFRRLQDGDIEIMPKTAATKKGTP